MKSYYLVALIVLYGLRIDAQINPEKLVGEWKLYLDDKTTFEYLRLDANGTGLKCFGQTMNGRDTFYLDHITALKITKWNIDANKLFIHSKNTLSFKPNPEYKVSVQTNDKIELTGQHFLFYVYPSILNRDRFQRSVIYQKATTISGDFGVTTAKCISFDRKLFSLTPVNDSIQLASYKGFDDLIPHLAGCNLGYEYVQKYSDPAYSLQMPSSIRRWSFGFGNRMFYFSFNSDTSDKSETTIVIYYDFNDELKNHFFSEIQKGTQKKDVIVQNNLEVYKFINWEDKYEGRVFLKNSIIVAYYTRDNSLQEKLQKCITSFKYK